MEYIKLGWELDLQDFWTRTSAFITLCGHESTDVVVSTVKCWATAMLLHIRRLTDYHHDSAHESPAITNVCGAVRFISLRKCFAALAKCIVTNQTKCWLLKLQEKRTSGSMELLWKWRILIPNTFLVGFFLRQASLLKLLILTVRVFSHTSNNTVCWEKASYLILWIWLMIRQVDYKTVIDSNWRGTQAILLSPLWAQWR